MRCDNHAHRLLVDQRAEASFPCFDRAAAFAESPDAVAFHDGPFSLRPI